MNIFTLIQLLFNIYTVILVIYVLMSWIPQLRDSGVGALVGWLAEPYLSIFRRFIPPIGMIDISPIVAFFALQFVEQGVYFIVDLILRNL
ncbi:YggT family protein [Marininema halotolerans]|uniref:YggT family protein n=1 Tax=Marininema halotolerans TaxID=1155944 RepID=A0A1I6QCN4_9BACL|nr:YggT family protein [Marininema halotolerans]SFS50237.1 YggT family protein [Marininema halotolerans]